MRNCLLVLSVLLLGACAGQPVAVKVGEPQVWGGAPRVVPVSRLFIAGQPDDAALDEAERQGVAAIINLRSPTESDWDEAGAAVARNMAYHQVPVSGADPQFDPAVIARISSLVAQYPDRRVLLHCSSGNRAAAWLAIHLVQHHGMTTNAALEVARPAGLTYAPLEEKVRRFLGDKAVTP